MSKRTFADHDVIVVNSGFEAILIAPPSLLSPNIGKKLKGLPKSAVQDATAIARMRQRLSSKGHSLPSLSDYDVLLITNSDIEHGRLTAIALPRTSISSNDDPDWVKVIEPFQQKIAEIWHTVEHRVKVVISRTLAKLPAAEGRMLAPLLTPENIGGTIGCIVAVAILAGTPEGLLLDAALLAIAYICGGVAVIQALGDFLEFCTKLVTAQSDQDLDKAADALARFIAAAGVVALTVLVHEIGKRLKLGERLQKFGGRFKAKAFKFVQTRPIVLNSKASQPLWRQYEAAVRALHPEAVQREIAFNPWPNEQAMSKFQAGGRLIQGKRVDSAAFEGNDRFSLEFKFVKDGWENSAYNPNNPKAAKLPFMGNEAQRMMAQARTYVYTFKRIVYYTNSPELAQYYTRAFQQAGIGNFEFRITPVTILK